jgi:4-diphosphocytidyl-2-C-methyl-D-erythritol kinase
MIEEFAPAKINLYLRITGRRDDGYHFMDSLVAFASIGDIISLTAADDYSLTIEGPMAVDLAREDPDKNLISKALRLLADHLGRRPAVAVTLQKHLPIASGIGGGSSDAAAALRAAAKLWDVPVDDPCLYTIAAKVGQDIPACVALRPCYFEGVGDVVSEGPALPPVGIILVNPLIPLPTPDVFKARHGDFSKPNRLPKAPMNATELSHYLLERGNDLTDPAAWIVPEIPKVLATLRAHTTLYSGMSGSGATCFGLCENQQAAIDLQETLQKQHPNWWIKAGQLL